MVKARSMEFIRDKANLVWSLVFPVILVGGLALAFSGNGDKVFKIGIIGNPETASLTSINEIEFITYPDELDTRKNAEKKLLQHQLDLLIDPISKTYQVNSESSKSIMAERILKAELPEYSGNQLNGKPIRYVDWVVPGIIGMNMVFSTLFGVGYVIVRYRKNGVLKRLKATPVAALNFLSAQAFSRLVIVLSTTLVVFLGTNLVLKFTMNGSWLDLLILYTLGVSALISLGLVIASRFKNEEVTNGIINLLVFPMMLLSEVFFSLEGAPDWLKQGAQFLPLTPLIDGARKIMLDGAGLWDLLPQMGILGGITVICLFLSAKLFRWD